MALSLKDRKKLSKKTPETFDFCGIKVPIKKSLGRQNQLMALYEDVVGEPGRPGRASKHSEFQLRLLEFLMAELPEDERYTYEQLEALELEPEEKREFNEALIKLVQRQMEALGLASGPLEATLEGEEGKLPTTPVTKN